MHISGLAIEKFDIRANRGTWDEWRYQLSIVTQETSRHEYNVVVVVK